MPTTVSGGKPARTGPALHPPGDRDAGTAAERPVPYGVRLV